MILKLWSVFIRLEAVSLIWWWDVFIKYCNKNSNTLIVEFERVLTEILSQSDNLICVGYFNINLFDVGSTVRSNYREVLDSLGLKQVIGNLTRI